MAFMPSAVSSACTSTCLSSCTTLTPLLIVNVNEPLAPFSVMASAPIVAVTPCGRSTGIFATRDINKTLVVRLELLDDEQHFPARAGSARLFVRHDALGRRDHRDAPAAQHRWRIGPGAIN